MESALIKLLTPPMRDGAEWENEAVLQDIIRKQVDIVLTMILPIYGGGQNAEGAGAGAGAGVSKKKKKEPRPGPAAWYNDFKTITGAIVIKADIDDMAKENGQTLTARNKCFSTLPEGRYKGWKGFYKACQNAFEDEENKNCSTYGAAAFLFRIGGLKTVQAEDEEDEDTGTGAPAPTLED
jgi:hypothetical protein